MSLERPRRLRHDRDRARLGCRQHRHHGHLRPRRPRSSSSTRPFRAAWKDYLGNAALRRHGRRRCSRSSSPAASTTACTRSTCRSATTNGDFLPGIGGEDDGVKGGLNGIDNGRLHFDRRPHPAHRTCSTATATSPPTARTARRIASPGRRFFTMLGTLVQGRVSLDGAATTGTALALDDRHHLRQPAPPVRRRRATPTRRCCSTTSGTSAGCCRGSPPPTPQSFAHDELLHEVRRRLLRPQPTPTRTAQDLETLAAALKPLSTWHALDTLQECREACGGAGFLAENRLVGAARRPRRLRHVRGRQQRAAAARRQAPARRLRQQVQGQGCRGARPLRRRADGRHGLPRHRACASSARRSRDFGSTARSVELACGADHAARAARRTACETMVGGCRRPRCARHPSCRTTRPRPAVQRAPERADRGGPRARRAAAVGGVHRRARAGSRTPGTKQVLTWLRDLFGLTSSRSTSPGT